NNSMQVLDKRSMRLLLLLMSVLVSTLWMDQAVGRSQAPMPVSAVRVSSTEAGGTATPLPPPTCTPAWSLIASPNVAASSNYLLDVAGVARDDGWAVGYSSTGSPAVERTLALHWNGDEWRLVPSPNIGAGQHELSGVAARAA